MQEVIGNLWDFQEQAMLVLTTNGSLSRDGRASLGRGCARQAENAFQIWQRASGHCSALTAIMSMTLATD